MSSKYANKNSPSSASLPTLDIVQKRTTETSLRLPVLHLRPAQSCGLIHYPLPTSNLKSYSKSSKRTTQLRRTLCKYLASWLTARGDHMHWSRQQKSRSLAYPVQWSLQCMCDAFVSCSCCQDVLKRSCDFLHVLNQLLRRCSDHQSSYDVFCHDTF